MSCLKSVPDPCCSSLTKLGDYIDVGYDGWKMKENVKKVTLWRPIKRLMAKARYV